MAEQLAKATSKSQPNCPTVTPTINALTHLPDSSWLHVLQRDCDFGPDIFRAVSLNLLKNPNINSSLLFRADILYDSRNEVTDEELDQEERDQALQDYNIDDGDLAGFEMDRTILRRMIPRNPQLDKPILQTCLFLHCSPSPSVLQTLVVYIPHSATAESMPWYHPRVQALAYLHTWSPKSSSSTPAGSISLHYQLYPTDALPISTRLARTAHHLLSTIIKHGQGHLQGYNKRVHHDQLVSQQRIQDTYTVLKRKHANRLCDNWVEQTEPSKHVFEDLGIAAFLIELWRDMYLPPHPPHSISDDEPITEFKPPFPGFVDIGCGNGVLVDTLLREGYVGWGFDLRARKTWATFVPSTRKQLKEMTLVPAPLSSAPPSNFPASPSITHHRWWSLPRPPSPQTTHDGLFAPHTFIISNHADELTPWTPLLASLSQSPFLCIPCCSHNLSGARFRAPSVFNNQSADAFAPSYFENYVTGGKAVAIGVAEADYGVSEDEDTKADASNGTATTADDDNEHETPGRNRDNLCQRHGVGGQPAETGDLKVMKTARKKQPSAYASLCDWVAHLAAECGYEVEKEMLRLPSTRNVGIVGRRVWKQQQKEAGEGFGTELYLKIADMDLMAGKDARSRRKSSGASGSRRASEAALSLGEWRVRRGNGKALRIEEGMKRWERVRKIVEREGANREGWVSRAEGLGKGGGSAEH